MNVVKRGIGHKPSTGTVDSMVLNEIAIP